MTGFVYAVENARGEVKIGFSENVAKRFVQLQVGASEKMDLLGVVPGEKHHEKALHEVLDPWRRYGEWFEKCPAMQPFLDGLRSPDVALASRPICKAAFNSLAKAKKLAGGNTGLAKCLSNITPQAVSQWRKVPANRVIDVERATGVSRSELRPDLYPPEEVSEAAQ